MMSDMKECIHRPLEACGWTTQPKSGVRKVPYERHVKMETRKMEVVS